MCLHPALCHKGVIYLKGFEILGKIQNINLSTLSGPDSAPGMRAASVNKEAKVLPLVNLT